MNTQTFSVTGMTCGHCVGAVTDELKALDGVTRVDVELVAGGTSTVTVSTEAALGEAAVAAALDEAGEYRLERIEKAAAQDRADAPCTPMARGDEA